MHYLLSSYIDILLIISLILPFLTSLIPILVNKSYRFKAVLSLMMTILVFINISCITIYYYQVGTLYITFGKVADIDLALKVEPVGLIFAIMASLLWVLTTIYSIGYIAIQNSRSNIKLGNDLKTTPFFSFMGLSMTFTFGVAFSANILTLFVFYELLTLATYPLIIESGTNHAKNAGQKYLVTMLITSLGIFLPTIIYTYHLAGNGEFTMGGIFTNIPNDCTMLLLMLGYFFGISKIAIVPFHSWLKSAMVAPIPVSALLHAVAVVKAGLIAIIKIAIYVFGINNLLDARVHFPEIASIITYIACFTILYASIKALRESNLKQRLAYSTIAQLSYCLVAIAIFTPKGIIAAILHMVGHSVSKITLFFSAGAIYTSLHKTDINEMKSISKYLKYPCLCFSLAAISIVGVPPLALFFSKFLIIKAAWASQHNQILIVGTIIISTALSCMNYLPIILNFYAIGNEEDIIMHHRQNIWTKSAILATCLLTCLLFMLMQPIFSLLLKINMVF